MVATKKVVWSELVGTTAATAKAWITALYNNLKSVGLVQTDDTGQLNPDTITTYPAAGVYFGYFVFRFNDELQNSKPVFIRFAPFVGSHGGANSAGLAVTVGFSTDGAGNITGPNSGLMSYFNSTSGAQRTESGVATASYAIHGEGQFSLLAHAEVRRNGYNTFCMSFVSITRTLDLNGAPTTEGVVIRCPVQSYDVTGIVGATALICRKMLLGAAAGSWNSLLTPWIGGADSASSAGNAQIQRTYYLTPTIKADPAMVLYWNASITAGDEFEVPVDGFSRSYLAIGNGNTLVADASNARNVGFGILWGDL